LYFHLLININIRFLLFIFICMYLFWPLTYVGRYRSEYIHEWHTNLAVNVMHCVFVNIEQGIYRWFAC